MADTNPVAAVPQADPNAWKAECFANDHPAGKNARDPAKRMYCLYYRTTAGKLLTLSADGKAWVDTEFESRADATAALTSAPKPE